MITIVLTNRNRDLKIVNNCLDSLNKQSNNDFELFFVDYGSNDEYLLDLKKLISKYPKIQFIACPVSEQLWNKSRAINIALKKCNTEFFFVGDIDMLFCKDFIKTLYKVKNEKSAIYFRVGFLSKEETNLNKGFEESNISFASEKEATGMTLYPTKSLIEINGYDEFYHGWGAEDTDVHIRLYNFGIEVNFYEEEILLKHQWHPKTYRSIRSKNPLHFNLEKINHSYIRLSQTSKRTLANINCQWGAIPNQNHYLKLSEIPDFKIAILPEKPKINAFLGQMSNFGDEVIHLIIKDTTTSNKIKQEIKSIFGKKSSKFLSLKKINDMILQEIIVHYRNLPYQYSYNHFKKEIELKIYFPK